MPRRPKQVRKGCSSPVVRSARRLASESCERKAKRGLYGGPLEPDQEADYDRRMKAELAALAGTGLAPVGSEGEEEIGKPYVLGTDLVVIII